MKTHIIPKNFKVNVLILLLAILVLVSVTGCNAAVDTGKDNSADASTNESAAVSVMDEASSEAPANTSEPDNSSPAKELSDKEVTDIDTAWSAANGVTFFADAASRKLKAGTYYYGTYGDSCHVLFERGELTEEMTSVIADYEFSCSSSFGIYVCRNAELMTLAEAYEKGYISKEDIGAVHGIHDDVMEKGLDLAA